MNIKNTIVGIVVILFLAVTGYYVYQRPEQPSTGTSNTDNTETVKPAGVTRSISMNAEGFSPNSLTVKASDTVVFKNDDTRNRWPASGVHPTHKICAGLDSLGPVQAGRSYAYTFFEAKECPIHDHLAPSLKGKITVTP